MLSTWSMELRLTDPVVGRQKGGLVSSLSSAAAWQSCSGLAKAWLARQAQFPNECSRFTHWVGCIQQGTIAISKSIRWQKHTSLIQNDFQSKILNVHSLRQLGVFACRCLHSICCIFCFIPPMPHSTLKVWDGRKVEIRVFRHRPLPGSRNYSKTR